MLYLYIKLIHVISSTFLFGTGLGSAFYLFRANQTKDLQAMHFAAKNCVLADWLFTAPSVIVQPITGFWMIHIAHFPISSVWIYASLILYVIAGACWIPVVHLQIKMRDMLQVSLEKGSDLPKQYDQYFRAWFWLGWPAFIGVVVIFWLMFLKP